MEEGDNTVRQIIIVVVICLGGLLYRVYSCVKPRFRDMRLDVEESGAPVSRELQSLATSRQALYAHCVPKWETAVERQYRLRMRPGTTARAIPQLTCSVGHRLSPRTERPSRYTNPWHCSVCLHYIPVSARPVLHCDTCTYDVCRACVPATLPRLTPADGIVTLPSVDSSGHASDTDSIEVTLR